MRTQMRRLDEETFSWKHILTSCASTASTLQLVLEGALERKSGTSMDTSVSRSPAPQIRACITVVDRSGSRYGPPGTRHLVYFVDDINMAAADKYDTQTAVELIRQAVDCHGWFDTEKTNFKVCGGARLCIVVRTCRVHRPLGLQTISIMKHRSSSHICYTARNITTFNGPPV